MPKRILTGTVVSDKGDKTIVVKVERTTRHPVYGKILRTWDKFHAHDESNSCKMGDKVAIIECAPHSKLKHFELKERLQIAGEQITDTASELLAHVSAKDVVKEAAADNEASAS
jgi:small subunit ribosomal protein S17